MIVYALTEERDQLDKLGRLGLYVAEPLVVSFFNRMARNVDAAEEIAQSPLALDGTPSPEPYQRCCSIELLNDGESIQLRGYRKGYEEWLHVRNAVLAFGSSERALLAAFLRSQCGRVAVGPPYGGQHYDLWKKQMGERVTPFESDLEIMILREGE